MTIFEARVHEAMGNNVKAIRVLTKKPCYDQLTKNEKLVDNYIKQGNKDKAVEHLE